MFPLSCPLDDQSGGEGRKTRLLTALKKLFGTKLNGTAIPRNIRLAEAPRHGQPALVEELGKQVVHEKLTVREVVSSEKVDPVQRVGTPVSGHPDLCGGVARHSARFD